LVSEVIDLPVRSRPVIAGWKLSELVERILDDDGAGVRRALLSWPELAAVLDRRWFAFGTQAVVFAAFRGARGVVDALLDAGADIDAGSDWPAGGFSALHAALGPGHTDLAAHLVRRGARVDAHAAAGLGDVTRLDALLDADPAAATTRGPDGQHPLHLAASTEVAELLLERGADVAARCLDHDSTPLQYVARRSPDVARRLLERGAEADVFVAAVLGDEALVRKALRADKGALRARLGQPGYAAVPPGNILQWRLGDLGHSPAQIASAAGHGELAAWILSRCSKGARLREALWTADAAEARRLAAAHPRALTTLRREEAELLPEAAGQGRRAAVALLLEHGFDPEAVGVVDATALDRAAFAGRADIIELLLAAGQVPLERRNAFGGKPLGTLLYAAGAAGASGQSVDFRRGVELLLAAGCRPSAREVARAPSALASLLRPYVVDPPGPLECRHAEDPPRQGAVAGALQIDVSPSPCATPARLEGHVAPHAWSYDVSVHNSGETPLSVVAVEGYRWARRSWIPDNPLGRSLGAEDFAAHFTAGDAGGRATLPPGGTATYAGAWAVAETPARGPAKWAVRAVEGGGRELYAETVVELLPLR
jgi:ankyrin repeat protein